MKKVCIISSSPRKNGNSQVLCQQFAKGVKEAGHEVEIIDIGHSYIKPCLGCEYCRQHQNKCFQKDVSQEIIDKMINADVWVLSTPVYFYSVSAQMKLLIDRFFAREYEIRQSTKRKEIYYIVTSGNKNIESGSTIESLRGFIKVLRNFDEKGIVDGCGAFEINDVYKHTSFEVAYKLGKEI